MSFSGALALACLLATCAQDSPQVEVQAEADSLPPRSTIAGMPGLYTRSHITFFEAPDQPHDLQVVLLFEGRARIQLSASAADWHARQLEYRAGDAFYFTESGSATSELLAGRRRVELELRIELRRALLLWPDGVAWVGEGATRTTPVAGAGSLEVALDDAGRPRSMRALDLDGDELEAYAAIEWFERHDRTWPGAMDFSYGGVRVWREELFELSVRPNFLDWFFVPADRRPAQPLAFNAAEQVRNIDLRPAVVRRFEIEGEHTWADLLELGAELVVAARAELEGLGLAVDDPVNFLLSEEGRPTHCELRLASTVATPPPGWTAVSERPGLTLFGTGPPRQLKRTLERLRSLAPEGAELGHPYVRARPGAGVGGKLQVVLPLGAG